jgi:hypothetical protein
MSRTAAAIPTKFPSFIRTDPAPVEIQAEAAPTITGKGRVRRFTMLAYNGGALKFPGYLHPVVIDLQGMRGLDKTRPALKNHDPEQLVGHVDSMTVKAGTLYAAGAVSGGTEAADAVLRAADSGFPWQASIGARPERVEFVQPGQFVTANGRKFEGPVYIVRTSTLGEISFVPIGADDSTTATISATRKPINMDPITDQNGVTVTTATPNTGATLQAGAMFGDEPAVVERKRIATIVKARRQHGHTINATALNEIEAKAIEEGWDPTKAELELLRAARPAAAGGGFRGGASAPDDFKILEASMCLTAGVPEKLVAKSFDERTVDAATSAPHRGASIHAALRATLRAAGRHVPDRVDSDTIRAAFEADRMLRASGFSTISLPGILGNVANKSMLAAYQAQNTTWQLFCALGDNKDFKPATRYRLTGEGEFKPVAPDGRIHHIGLTEESYTSQIGTEGALIGLTRQAIINDDMGMLTQTPKIIGRMDAIAQEKAVYTLLLSNPAGFFASGNGNYQEGSGTVLGVDSLTAAETLFLKQVDDNGDPILVAPAVLLVPPELNVSASSLTRTLEIRDTTASTKYTTNNPHAGRFTSAASPWLSNTKLTGYSTTAWYLLAGPGDVAIMEMAFLNGQQNPTIESGDTSFDTLGMMWRGFHDWGVSMRDKRAGVKSKGAT